MEGQIDIGSRRSCGCPPGHLNCLDAKEWMKAQPTGIEGRRQMPQFNLSEQELTDLANFFEWVSNIQTQNWPPNDAG